ncbi:unnamed protein product, partial [Porites evermanni]
MMVFDEEKRWIVVGIAMNKVAAPVLRDAVNRGMNANYANLDRHCQLLHSPCTLKTLTHGVVRADPILKNLKFQNINNNHLVHGVYNYNFDIDSSLDLAKLYLPGYLAQFSGFDDSLDMTAILRLLGFRNFMPAAVFSPHSQASADDVRENVRNKWGHVDITEWTDALFNDCFDKLKTLVRSLGLTADVEKNTLDQLDDWQTKGCQLIMGHAVDRDLLCLVQDEVKDLINDYTTIHSQLNLHNKQIAQLEGNVATLTDQDQRKETKLVEHHKRLEALEEKLHVQQAAEIRSEETGKVLKRLMSFKTLLSIRLQTVEEKVDQQEQTQTKTDDRVRQLEQSQTNAVCQVELLKDSHTKTADEVELLKHSHTKTADEVELLKHKATNASTFDLKACRSKLADYYKRTAKVPMSVWSSVGQVKLDQIYTRLSWVKRENTPTGTFLSELKHYGELFTADENGVVPKRILVQGETGIGKSTFVQKLALDWAELGNDDVAAEQGAAARHSESYKKPLNYDRKDIIQPPIKEANTSDRTCYESYRDTHFQTDSLKKFKLVIIVTLKDVSKCQTFREVLSLSRLIPKDKESLTGDLFTYICNNQDNVLLVFDGYDEYRSGSVAEAHFGPRSTSPICEIFHRYELRDCTVLVTARSSRADELQESADKHAEIIGFDEGDRLAFMRKVLESSRQVSDLHNFLMRKELSDLARVPLLNLFFCMLFRQEKESLMELGKTKTPLYQAIIRYILQHSSRRLPSAKTSKVKEEDYKEILAEIGKVALESLLKGSHVFEYGELSEKVRGEESVMMGLLQLSENEASLEPTEVVSFIHKSIQEYLAAWFIANRCVLEGNLGGIERHATTLEDCQSMANVFQFVCGLSKDGAIKVMAHFSTVHANDASVDFSQIIPVEETEMPLTEITRTHERFNDLVLSCYREGSSKPDLIEHVFGCTGGIILLDRPIDAFIKKNCAEGDDSIVYLHESVKFLDLLHIPLRIFRNSKELKLGDFLTKFNSRVCSYDCAFSSVLCFRDGKMTIYITDLTLMCDMHRSLFIETAASVSHQSLSRDLCSSQSCLKFLTSLNFSFYGFELQLLEVLAASRRKCKRLQGTDNSGNGDYVLDFLEQM